MDPRSSKIIVDFYQSVVVSEKFQVDWKASVGTVVSLASSSG